jgi:hypothetical protein
MAEFEPNSTMLDQLLERHYSLLHSIQIMGERLTLPLQDLERDLELSICLENEFRCRTEIVHFHPGNDSERQKKTLHLAGFLIAFNCPLNAPISMK